MFKGTGRKEFFEYIVNKFGYGTAEMEKIQTAYWLCKNAHRPQTRDDGERYFEHPLRVVKILIDHNYYDANMIAAAFLHDVVEDTFTPQAVIINLFGPVVWNYVSLLSKTRHVLDPLTLELFSKSKKDTDIYYNDISAAPKEVRLIKIADRLDNVSDIETFSDERKIKYITETNKYILPIAYKTDYDIAEKIKSHISKIMID